MLLLESLSDSFDFICKHVTILSYFFLFASKFLRFDLLHAINLHVPFACCATTFVCMHSDTDTQIHNVSAWEPFHRITCYYEVKVHTSTQLITVSYIGLFSLVFYGGMMQREQNKNSRNVRKKGIENLRWEASIRSCKNVVKVEQFLRCCYFPV